jgi:hypothetical protein
LHCAVLCCAVLRCMDAARPFFLLLGAAAQVLLAGAQTPDRSTSCVLPLLLLPPLLLRLRLCPCDLPLLQAAKHALPMWQP